MEVPAKSLAKELIYTVGLYTAIKHLHLNRAQQAIAAALIALSRTPMAGKNVEVTQENILYGMTNAAKAYVDVFLLVPNIHLVTELGTVIGHPPKTGLFIACAGWGAARVWDIATAKDPTADRNNLAKWVVSWTQKEEPKNPPGIGKAVSDAGKRVKKALQKVTSGDKKV